MRVTKYLPFLALIYVIPGHAFQFNTGPKTSAALDVTLTYGLQYRIDDADDKLLEDQNQDESNRNFESGLASHSIRAVADFEWRFNADNGDSYGLFARGTAVYDDRIYNATNDHDSRLTYNGEPYWDRTLPIDEFTKKTEDRSGMDVELLDMMVFAELGATGDHASSIRVGRQVINWGESAFIQNGLSSVINSADISKATLPGTEVKEILRPLGAVFGSIALNENISLSAYVQYEWEEIIAPPYGTFLSPVPDPLTGDALLVPLAGFWAGTPAEPLIPLFAQAGYPYTPVNRARTEDASDSGQWGVSASWYLPDLGDTELGFYMGNYHRKRATIAITSAFNAPDVDWFDVCSQAVTGGNGCPFAGAPGGGPLAPIILTDGAEYELQFVDDVEYYGISWNSLIAATETAFSGEIIYHHDVPIQTNGLTYGLQGTLLGAMGPNPPGTSNSLFTRQDMIVTQVTFNQNFTPSWADDASLIVEIGHIYIDDVDDKGGLNNHPAYKKGDVWSANVEADTSSWAYRAKFSATWYDGLGKMVSALTGTDLIWSVDFNHDVDGVSPVVGTGYVEGAMAFSTALEASWQNTWSAKLNYTNFFGDGYDTRGTLDNNGDGKEDGKLGDHVMGDRDFLSLAVKYRF